MIIYNEDYAHLVVGAFPTVRRDSYRNGRAGIKESWRDRIHYEWVLWWRIGYEMEDKRPGFYPRRPSKMKAIKGSSDVMRNGDFRNGRPNSHPSPLNVTYCLAADQVRWLIKDPVQRHAGSFDSEAQSPKRLTFSQVPGSRCIGSPLSPSYSIRNSIPILPKYAYGLARASQPSYLAGPPRNWFGAYPLMGGMVQQTARGRAVVFPLFPSQRLSKRHPPACLRLSQSSPGTV